MVGNHDITCFSWKLQAERPSKLPRREEDEDVAAAKVVVFKDRYAG